MPLAITGLPLTCSVSAATGPGDLLVPLRVGEQRAGASTTGTLPPMLYSLFSGPVRACPRSSRRHRSGRAGTAAAGDVVRPAGVGLAAGGVALLARGINQVVTVGAGLDLAAVQRRACTSRRGTSIPGSAARTCRSRTGTGAGWGWPGASPPRRPFSWPTVRNRSSRLVASRCAVARSAMRPPCMCSDDATWMPDAVDGSTSA